MEQGTMKWFSKEKGFGFILCDGDQKEYFIHQTEVQPGVMLDQNMRVQFEIGEGKKGPEARNCSLLEE